LSSEYQIKLEVIREYEDALKTKKLLDDLTHELAGLLPQIITVLSRNSTSLRDREILERTLERVQNIIQNKIGTFSPETERSLFSPEDGREPNSCRESIVFLQFSIENKGTPLQISA